MKSLIIIGSILISSFAMANNCIITAPAAKAELTQGSNKDTICREARLALALEDSQMIQLAVINQEMFSVKLSYVVTNSDGSEVSQGIGTQIWYPGDSYFILGQ